MTERIAIIDFETTGMSPAYGARAAEVGIVMIEGGRIVDRYQSLMNAGVHMPFNLEQFTGISNAMLQAAPAAEHVMREAAAFVGNAPMVAHNAPFDSKFWANELQLAGCAAEQPFVCTVRLSRRLNPQAPSHSLGQIVRFLQLPPAQRAHRALADAEMTAHLLLHMQNHLQQHWGIAQPSYALLQQLQGLQSKKVPAWLQAAGLQLPVV